MTSSCPDLDLPTKLTCSDIDSDEDCSDDEDPDPMEVPLPRLQSFDVAISYLGDICDLLEHRGYTKEANSSNTLLDDLARLHSASLTKQKSITDYF